jgi:DNA-binding response OmpR family regulator
MNPPTRPAPEILFIHNRRRYDGHIRHLSDAGLRVSEAHATVAVAQAMRLQPDIIVLDFDCNGELVAQLKGDPRGTFPSSHSRS